MKNVVVLYKTVTKHSKKLAEAIGSALSVDVLNVMDQPILLDVDLLFIVGGIYGGKSSPELLDYVQNIKVKNVKEVALVTSCLSKRQYQSEIKNILESNDIKVIDEFLCRGGLFLFYMRHPNQVDLKEAQMFAKRILDEVEMVS